MHELVAIDLPGGPAFEEALRRVWDDGDAAMPVDQRLPRQVQVALLDAARPHAIIGGTDPVRVPLEPGAPPMEPGDAVVVASSGSTGTPKLVVHTDESLSRHAWAVQGRLEIDPGSDRWLACLPLGHMGGLGVLTRAIITDTPVDVIERFSAADVAAAPAVLGSTLVSLVPTAIDRLDPSPFRWVVLGGSHDPMKRPANVVRTYGLTETGGGVVYEGTPLPGIDVRIREGNQIAIRGSMLSRGIRTKSGEVTPIVDADGWFLTGDLGHWDGYSKLVVDGRAEDLIISGGENVWPGPIEAVLATHPGIAEVRVIGRPDHEWGERVVAVVVPTNPGWPPSLDEVRGHVSLSLPVYAAPRELVIVESLPKTLLGKVRRPRFEDSPDPDDPTAGRQVL